MKIHQVKHRKYNNKLRIFFKIKIEQVQHNQLIEMPRLFQNVEKSIVEDHYAILLLEELFVLYLILISSIIDYYKY